MELSAVSQKSKCNGMSQQSFGPFVFTGQTIEGCSFYWSCTDITDRLLQQLVTGEEWLKFTTLVDKWHRERGATSSTTEMFLCESYQEIIAMGRKAIDLILAQLRLEGADPDHWFWALYVLNGCQSPVPREDEGNLRKMAEAWLKWGEGR